jgi:hypothetical protein
MFIKLMGRLLSRANSRKVQRHVETRKETAKVLRLFLDTILALQTANDRDEDAIETINRRVGWHRLLQVKPALEAMVENGDPDPLLVAVEHYPTIRKYAAQFLRTFSFRSARRNDPLLAAIDILKSLHDDRRRNLPDRIPIAHLGLAARKLILHDARPDRRLYELATLAALRERLRSADIWVEGSRAFRPMDEHLMPRPAFTDLKDNDQLGLGVQCDGAAWLADMQAAPDFNLKRLAYRARNGRLDGVRLEGGTLLVTPLASEVPPVNGHRSFRKDGLPKFPS